MNNNERDSTLSERLIATMNNGGKRWWRDEIVIFGAYCEALRQERMEYNGGREL